MLEEHDEEPEFPTLTVDGHLSQRRCTAHLRDMSLLRGTTSAVLLDSFGEILRSTTGGIDTVAGDEPDDFSKSVLVRELDIFLSHSWHACWWMKYLTLLYYFNALPATLSVVFVAGSWSMLQYHLFESSRWRGFVPTSLVFLVMLFSWHHLRALYGHEIFIFLDKVCIDQKNSERKTKGIKAIGGILNRSKTLLVAWDRSYFSRLWCTFELAAFLHSQPEGKVRCVPIILGRVVTEIALCTWLMELLRAWMDKYARNLAFFAVNLAFAGHFHDFLREAEELSSGLLDFDVRRAQCFCCSNDHKHPDTQAKLSCDRKLVEGSIAHWYGSGNIEDGVARFDDLIRGAFREQIREVIRGARMPYHLILVASVWPAMHQLDRVVEDGAPLTRCIRCAHIMFLGFPIVLAFLMAIMRRLMHISQLGKWSRSFIFATVNSLLHAASIRSGRLISKAHNSWQQLCLCILFLLAESLMVFFFFQDGGTKKKTVSIARRVKELAPKAFAPSVEVEMAAVN